MAVRFTCYPHAWNPPPEERTCAFAWNKTPELPTMLWKLGVS